MIKSKKVPTKGDNMNKLVPGALFSSRAATALREKLNDESAGNNPRLPQPDHDTRILDRGALAAEGFRKHDPDGSKLAKLFKIKD
jgi:hypothetical protein